MFGIGSVAMTELMLNHKTNSSSRTAELVNEISLIASVYDMAVSNRNDEMKVWAMCFYCVTLLSGFVSMVSLYPHLTILSSKESLVTHKTGIKKHLKKSGLKDLFNALNTSL